MLELKLGRLKLYVVFSRSAEYKEGYSR